MVQPHDPALMARLAMEDRGLELLVVIWVFTILAIGVVGLKIFTRAHILHALGWDDFFIFLSLVWFPLPLRSEHERASDLSPHRPW